MHKENLPKMTSILKTYLITDLVLFLTYLIFKSLPMRLNVLAPKKRQENPLPIGTGVKCVDSNQFYEICWTWLKSLDNSIGDLKKNKIEFCQDDVDIDRLVF